MSTENTTPEEPTTGSEDAKAVESVETTSYGTPAGDYGQAPNQGYTNEQPQYAQQQYTQPQYEQAQYGQTYQQPGVYAAPSATQYTQPVGAPVAAPIAAPGQKSRIAALLLAIFLGGLGVHNFYLGRVGLGVAQLLISLLSFGMLAWASWIWAVIEGILYMTSSDPRWATDARGVPLA